MKIRFRAFLVSGALLLAVAPVLSACDQYDDSDSRSFDVKDKVTGVTVDSAGGDIDVVAGDGDGVHVTENLKYKSGKRPSTEHFVRDGDLHLKVATSCGSSLGSANCTVNYRVEVPAGCRLAAQRRRHGEPRRRLRGVDAPAGRGGQGGEPGGRAPDGEFGRRGHQRVLVEGARRHRRQRQGRQRHPPCAGQRLPGVRLDHAGVEKGGGENGFEQRAAHQARTFAGDVKVLVAG